MKRMVENSEKIEELASAVEVDNDNVKFNGDLITSNITNTVGEKFHLISQNTYTYTATGDISLYSMNFGTAVVISGNISINKENGDYELLRYNNTETSTGYTIIQITGEPVCSLYINPNVTDNEDAVMLTLDKGATEYSVTTSYRFAFILGTMSKEL